MDWKFALSTVVLIAQILTASAQEENPDCRLCSPRCISVPSADGTCPICICNGAALPDCPKLPDFCPSNCAMQRNNDGCNQCACRRNNPRVCPPLPPCPEECQQLMDEDGCPRCLCDAPPRNCPAINCPELCTEEVGADGCLSCRCRRTEVCPPVRPCLRGCIESDDESGCFACNCTLLSEETVTSPEVNPFGFGPLGPRRPNEDPREESFSGGRPPLPLFRCRNQRLICPSDCRVVVAAHGCRECVCGEDAYLCPGVPKCSNRCLFLSPEDKCCRCDCPGPQSGGILRIAVVRLPSLFRPFGQAGPFSPFGPFRPDIDFEEIPFFPSFSPEEPSNNCSVDPADCNPNCRILTDRDGCPMCDCPGDLCPRIRCPPRCVKQIDTNGCPVCNCGGGPELANPEAEPVNPFAPVEPFASSEPVNPFAPAEPFAPSEPANPFPPAEPTDPASPDVPVNPGIPLIPGAAEPTNPRAPQIPVDPIDRMMSVEPVDPETPAGPIDPFNPLVTDEVFPVNPALPEEPNALAPAEPMIPVEPMQPVETVDPITPVEPAAPVEPLNPAVPDIVPEPDSVFESTLRTSAGGSAQPNAVGINGQGVPVEAEAPLTPGEPFEPVNPDAENLIPVIPETGPEAGLEFGVPL